MNARCEHFGTCGGCQFQDQAYEEQLQAKQQELSLLLGRPVEMRASPTPWAYRNRIDLTIRRDAIGLKGADRVDLVPIRHCAIISEAMNTQLQRVREWMHTYGLTEKELRYVTLREGAHQEITVTSRADLPEELPRFLHAKTGGTVIACVNAHDDVGGEVRLVLGDELLPVTVGSKTFQTHHAGFFQASPDAFLQAVDAMRRFIKEEDSVLDIYCGVGAIGILLAPRHLVGVEANAQAVALARANAEANGVQATFIHSDAATYAQEHPADFIIVDPPRTGLGTAALKILAAAPRRIIYLSCNPKTQRKDLMILKQRYAIIHAEGFDFFPQTRHVESLVILERR